MKIKIYKMPYSVLTALWRCYDVDQQTLRLMGSEGTSRRRLY